VFVGSRLTLKFMPTGIRLLMKKIWWLFV